MASTATNAAFNIATVGAAGTAHRSVDEDFKRLPGNSAPLVARLGYGKPVGLDDQGRHQKIIDRDLPQTITSTVAMVTASTTITMSTTDAASLQLNQILLIDDELVRVTTLHATDPVVARAVGGTTATEHVDTSTIHILSPAFLDTDVFVESAKFRGEFKEFYPQQIMYEWSETAMRTASTSYLTKGQDELTFERANKMREAVNQLAKSGWYGKGIAPTSTIPGMFEGLSRLLVTNKNDSVGVLTATHLSDLAELIVANDNSIDTFDVWGNRNMKRIWDSVLGAYFDRKGDPSTSSVGLKMDSFSTSLGTFNYITDPQIRDGELYFMKPGAAKFHPIAVKGGFSPGWHEFTREPVQTNALLRQMAYYNLLTLLIDDERLGGRLKGITTTGSSYAGYV